MRRLRVVLVADSHLGFDHPVRPRVRRRRRGEDFLANYRAALQVAIEERVDLVVHGGDVFHSSRVPPSLVHQAFEPLKSVADRGIPVFVVPGNHERSRIPFGWLARHPAVHVFAEPATRAVETEGGPVVVAGMPCIRRNARARFPEALERTGWRGHGAGVRLLLVHQAVEGATVGPADFTFRRGHDVLRMRDVPPDFAAVLAGHIHRHQVLDADLAGRPAPAPVFYPGSVERTAFAERDEPKGFLVLEVEPSGSGGRVAEWSFRDLSARPMRIRELRVRGLDAAGVERRLVRLLASEPADAVLRIEVKEPPAHDASNVLSAARLRALAPPTMNVTVSLPGRPPRAGAREFRRARTRSSTPAPGPESVQRSLF